MRFLGVFRPETPQQKDQLHLLHSAIFSVRFPLKMIDYYFKMREMRLKKRNYQFKAKKKEEEITEAYNAFHS